MNRRRSRDAFASSSTVTPSKDAEPKRKTIMKKNGYVDDDTSDEDDDDDGLIRASPPASSKKDVNHRPDLPLPGSSLFWAQWREKFKDVPEAYPHGSCDSASSRPAEVDGNEGKARDPYEDDIPNEDEDRLFEEAPVVSITASRKSFFDEFTELMPEIDDPTRITKRKEKANGKESDDEVICIELISDDEVEVMPKIEPLHKSVNLWPLTPPANSAEEELMLSQERRFDNADLSMESVPSPPPAEDCPLTPGISPVSDRFIECFENYQTARSSKEPTLHADAKKAKNSIKHNTTEIAPLPSIRKRHINNSDQYGAKRTKTRVKPSINKILSSFILPELLGPIPDSPIEGSASSRRASKPMMRTTAPTSPVDPARRHSLETEVTTVSLSEVEASTYETTVMAVPVREVEAASHETTVTAASVSELAASISASTHETTVTAVSVCEVEAASHKTTLTAVSFSKPAASTSASNHETTVTAVSFSELGAASHEKPCSEQQVFITPVSKCTTPRIPQADAPERNSLEADKGISIARNVQPHSSQTSKESGKVTDGPVSSISQISPRILPNANASTKKTDNQNDPPQLEASEEQNIFSEEDYYSVATELLKNRRTDHDDYINLHGHFVPVSEAIKSKKSELTPSEKMLQDFEWMLQKGSYETARVFADGLKHNLGIKGKLAVFVHELVNAFGIKRALSAELIHELTNQVVNAERPNQKDFYSKLMTQENFPRNHQVLPQHLAGPRQCPLQEQMPQPNTQKPPQRIQQDQRRPLQPNLLNQQTTMQSLHPLDNAEAQQRNFASQNKEQRPFQDQPQMPQPNTQKPLQRIQQDQRRPLQPNLLNQQTTMQSLHPSDNVEAQQRNFVSQNKGQCPSQDQPQMPQPNIQKPPQRIQQDQRRPLQPNLLNQQTTMQSLHPSDNVEAQQRNFVSQNKGQCPSQDQPQMPQPNIQKPPQRIQQDQRRPLQPNLLNQQTTMQSLHPSDNVEAQQRNFVSHNKGQCPSQDQPQIPQLNIQRPPQWIQQDQLSLLRNLVNQQTTMQSHHPSDNVKAQQRNFVSQIKGQWPLQDQPQMPQPNSQRPPQRTQNQPSPHYPDRGIPPILVPQRQEYQGHNSRFDTPRPTTQGVQMQPREYIQQNNSADNYYQRHSTRQGQSLDRSMNSTLMPSALVEENREYLQWQRMQERPLNDRTQIIRAIMGNISQPMLPSLFPCEE